MFWRKHVPVLGLDTTSPPSSRGDGRLWGDGFEIETLIHLRVAEAGLQSLRSEFRTSQDLRGEQLGRLQ